MHLKKENMSIEQNINPDKIFNWTVDLHNKVKVVLDELSRSPI